jgi:hypothetical protein
MQGVPRYYGIPSPQNHSAGPIPSTTPTHDAHDRTETRHDHRTRQMGESFARMARDLRREPRLTRLVNEFLTRINRIIERDFYNRELRELLGNIMGLLDDPLLRLFARLEGPSRRRSGSRSPSMSDGAVNSIARGLQCAIDLLDRREPDRVTRQSNTSRPGRPRTHQRSGRDDGTPSNDSNSNRPRQTSRRDSVANLNEGDADEHHFERRDTRHSHGSRANTHIPSSPRASQHRYRHRSGSSKPESSDDDGRRTSRPYRQPRS